MEELKNDKKIALKHASKIVEGGLKYEGASTNAKELTYQHRDINIDR